MQQQLIEGRVFERIDFTTQVLDKADYEACTFLNCNLAEVDLSGFKFIECEFHDCNLSSVRLQHTGFQQVLFKNSKMLGMHFEKCNDFGFSIKVEHCQLNHSSFYKKKLPKTHFIKSKLQEVDFSSCDLSAVIFDDCDLLLAVFDNTDLRKADFRGSYNFVIDPENNRIKDAKFSLATLSGLLAKYNIKIENN